MRKCWFEADQGLCSATIRHRGHRLLHHHVGQRQPIQVAMGLRHLVMLDLGPLRVCQADHRRIQQRQQHSNPCHRQGLRHLQS